jgi:hypothetical protein
VPSTDVIEQMQQQDPQLLHGVVPHQARKLLSNVFAYINRRLARIEDGVLSCEGLGRFRVIKRSGAAKRRSAADRRIIFYPQSASTAGDAT